MYQGSAPPCGRTFAPGYGSYLLPLRYPLYYSQATLFSVRLKQEVFRSLPLRPLPVFACLFRVSDCESEPFGEVSSPGMLSRAGPSRYQNLLGHWVHQPWPKPSTMGRVTRLAAGFCPSRCVAFLPGCRRPPHVPFVFQAVTNPPGHMGDMCPQPIAKQCVEGARYQLSLTFLSRGTLSLELLREPIVINARFTPVLSKNCS